MIRPAEDGDDTKEIATGKEDQSEPIYHVFATSVSLESK